MSFLIQGSNTHLFIYTSPEHFQPLASWGYTYFSNSNFYLKDHIFLRLALPKMSLDFVDFWKSVSQILRFHLTTVYRLVFPVNIVLHGRSAWLSLTLKEHYEFSSRRQRASFGMQCDCLHFSTWNIERI